MANTPDYSINYDDPRFGEVESDREQALTETEQIYGGMIDDADDYYNAQIQASKDWAEEQARLQNERTDFIIEQTNQQKEQSRQDYLKEQSGSYVDWQKQSNQYGTEAERMASAGLTGTGYSESSQVSMYNTYQNRVATARESFNRAVLNYNNAIKDAMLQNNAALAQIAHDALEQQLALSLEGFQYKNQLILEQANKKQEIDNIYYNRYQDVLTQMNTENAMAEDIRQYNETMAFNREQFEEQIRQWQAEYDQGVREYEEQIRQWEAEYELAKKRDEREAKELEEKIKQAKQEQANWEAEMKLKRDQLAEEQRQFNILHQSVGTVSGSSGNSSGYKSSSGNTHAEQAIAKTSNWKGTTSKTTNTTSTQKEYPINQASVLALGMGPLNGTTLAKMVKAGQIEAYIKNGETYFRKKVGLPTDRLR